MQRSRTVAVLVGAGLVGALLGSTPLAAQAAQNWSSWGVYGPIYGTTYANRSGADDSLNSGATDDRTNTGTTVPPSYMGDQVRIIKPGGSICYSSPQVYNSTYSTYITYYAPAGSGSCPTGVNLYNQGETFNYNGGGYSPTFAFSSPYFTK